MAGAAALLAFLTVLLTHSDLDGVACAIIYAAATGRVDYRLVENGSVDVAVREAIAAGAGDLILADHSVSEAMVAPIEEFISGGGRFRMLDHHKSALPLAQRGWATVDLTRSAAGLLFDHLGRPPRLAEFAALVEDHDLWIHSDPRSRRLAALLGLLGHERFIERFTRRPRVDFTDGEELLLEVEARRQADYIERKLAQAQTIEAGGVRWAIVFAESYRSELAEAMLDRLGADATAIVNPAKATVSLRSRSIDVADVARPLGGGGHARAAAFTAQGTEIEQGLRRFVSDLAAALAKARGSGRKFS